MSARRTWVIWQFHRARSSATKMSYSHRWQSYAAFVRRPYFLTTWIFQRTTWMLWHRSGFLQSKCCHFHNALLVVQRNGTNMWILGGRNIEALSWRQSTRIKPFYLFFNVHTNSVEQIFPSFYRWSFCNLSKIIQWNKW